MLNEPDTWLCSYSSKYKLFTVINTSVAAWDQSNWQTFERDADLSDPEGNFDVFRACENDYPDESSTPTARHLKAEIRADDHGQPIAWHSKFNWNLLGSPTLFGPPDMWGRDGNDFIWVSGGGSMWMDDEVPTTWEPRGY